MTNICAVIVTYNRKKLLLDCIHALVSQSVKIACIYIVDNHSTDGTKLLLTETILFESDERTTVLSGNFQGVDVIYQQLTENTGGAGGFYHGLKSARELNKYDSFWLMDDDGHPSDRCLEMLLPYASISDYVMPINIDTNDHDRLSWPVRLRGGLTTSKYQKVLSHFGKTMSHVFPFNGCLLSKKIVDEVGYPNPALFIWGDEYDHFWRCIKYGYKPLTVTGAIFYHPSDKLSFQSIFFGLYKIPYTHSDWRFICLIRNSTYLYWTYSGKFMIPLKFIGYSYLLLIKQRDVKRFKLYVASVMDGISGKFDRHKRYID